MGIWDERTGSFVTFIKAQSTLTALIGSGDSCRVYPDILKQGCDMPALVYTRAGGERFRHLTGSTNKRRTVLHIYCYGSTRASADGLTQALIAVLENYRGTWTAGSIIVHDTQILDAPDDGYDQSKDGNYAVRYWSRVPMALIHSET